MSPKLQFKLPGERSQLHKGPLLNVMEDFGNKDAIHTLTAGSRPGRQWVELSMNLLKVYGSPVGCREGIQYLSLGTAFPKMPFYQLSVWCLDLSKDRPRSVLGLHHATGTFSSVTTNKLTWQDRNNLFVPKNVMLIFLSTIDGTKIKKLDICFAPRHLRTLLRNAYTHSCSVSKDVERYWQAHKTSILSRLSSIGDHLTVHPCPVQKPLPGGCRRRSRSS